MVPQTALFPADHGACLPNQRINLYTVALRRIDPPVFLSFFTTLVDLWERYPDYNGRLLIERYATDGASKVKAEETAYPWRDAKVHM
jgi:fumiquinazoline A oxidase